MDRQREEFAYDWDEAFDVTDFVIRLCLYNTDAGTEQLRRMLRCFSQHLFENEAELCLQSAAAHLNMDALHTDAGFSVVQRKAVAVIIISANALN